MAYRRRHGISKSSTFEEEIHFPPNNNTNNKNNSTSNSSSSSLASQAIRASAAHRDSSSLSTAYGDCDTLSSFNYRPKDSSTFEYASNESKGFWGVLAQKAKAILEDDVASQKFKTPSRMRPQMLNTSARDQFCQQYQSPESFNKADNPRFRKGLDALSSSINHIGDTIGNALEEGRTIVENKTADIINETRKLQIRRRGDSSEEQNQTPGVHNQWQQLSVPSIQLQMQTSQESRIKASRDVAMATAAKAKLLLRELKTVKADLAFANERSAQLEKENRTLRVACEKGDYPADDDMLQSQIRLQLETLLAEKARLTLENSIYARENRFLREIVEYHQLTMQDVVYLDEGSEEVTEVYPTHAVSRMLSVSPPSPTSPRSPESPPSTSSPLKEETIPVPIQPKAKMDISQSEAPPSCSSSTDVPQTETARDSMRQSNASPT